MARQVREVRQIRRVRIYDQEVKYDIVRRNIKYPRLEFKTKELVLILPKNCRDPESIIEKHKAWIYNKMSLINDSMNEAKKKTLDLKRTDKEFRDMVKHYVENVSKGLDIQINNIFFRNMKSKWGSCSSKKNLTINTHLKYLPENLIEYVIYHEMIHLIERKHNNHFWNMISQKFPEYQKMEQELFSYSFSIQKVLKAC